MSGQDDAVRTVDTSAVQYSDFSQINYTRTENTEDPPEDAARKHHQCPRPHSQWLPPLTVSISSSG